MAQFDWQTTYDLLTHDTVIESAVAASIRAELQAIGQAYDAAYNSELDTILAADVANNVILSDQFLADWETAHIQTVEVIESARTIFSVDGPAVPVGVTEPPDFDATKPENLIKLISAIGDIQTVLDPVENADWLQILKKYSSQIKGWYRSSAVEIFTPIVVDPTIETSYGNFSFQTAETRMQALVDQANAFIAGAGSGP